MFLKGLKEVGARICDSRKGGFSSLALREVRHLAPYQTMRGLDVPHGRGVEMSIRGLGPACAGMRSRVSLALGFAQMVSAGFTLALLVKTGLSGPVWLAFTFTSVLTMTRLLLFRGRRGRPPSLSRPTPVTLRSRSRHSRVTDAGHGCLRWARLGGAAPVCFSDLSLFPVS